MRSMKTLNIKTNLIAALTLISTVSAISTASAEPGASTTTARCLVDAPENIDPQDALAAGDVVCQDVRAHGISVGAPMAAGEAMSLAETYRVKLRKLGGVMILSLSHESAAGAILRSERVQLKGLEELLVVSPRLAKALITPETLEETATVTTLGHEETRDYGKKPGEFLWGLSVEGLAIPSPFMVVPGLGLHAVYETPTAALTAKAAFHAVDGGNTDGAGFNLSVGGRKIFGQSDTAFFAGGGLAWSGYYAEEFEDTSESWDSTSYEGQGFEAYGEVGAELFRFYEARVLFGARVALPFYMLQSREYSDILNADGSYDYTVETDEKYMAPVTLSATVLW